MRPNHVTNFVAKMSTTLNVEIPLQINPDLQEERDRSSFNVTELTHFIDGGIEKTRKRKKIGANH